MITIAEQSDAMLVLARPVMIAKQYLRCFWRARAVPIFGRSGRRRGEGCYFHPQRIPSAAVFGRSTFPEIGTGRFTKAR